MLTAEQRHELDTTGITYMRGVLPRATTDEMVERIWTLYAEKSVSRDDPATWPIDILLQTKLQRLRKSGVFAPFGTAEIASVLDEMLGDWNEPDPWGGPLITFPQTGPWQLPKKNWHFDYRAQGRPDRPFLMRMFGFVTDVAPQGGGTLVVEGSHEVVRRMVAETPDHNAGSSAEIKKRLAREYPWFAAPSLEPGDAGGVRVCVRELTGQAGDVALMLPWTMHNIAMNCSDQPRFMVTHTVFAAG